METLMTNNDECELLKRLGKRLEFGTAGLRGRMGAGFNMMNDLIVLQASQGLCAYLLKIDPMRATQKGVVIGFDGRHNSLQFAHITASAFLLKGVPVHLFRTLVPTPFVPFAITHLGLAAGVMVTASHNPKQDNGYKVYLSNGCQITAPHDTGISQCIQENLVPWEGVNTITVDGNALLHDPTDEINKAYYKTIEATLCFKKVQNTESKLVIVHTAMHGVAHPYTSQSFKVFGLPAFVPTKEQMEADPEFPTVSYPNPEEGKGALALAIQTAEAHRSRLILANDPDADRLAVAEKLPSGAWRILHGNETGALLAWWTFASYLQAHPGVDVSKLAMLASTVSSKMLKAMAKMEGFYFEETLTGFKWLGNRARDLEKNGYHVLLAFEEAIGYMPGTTVPDKDGVSTAAVFAEMASHLATLNKTVTEQMESLYERYGRFIQKNKYFICENPDTIRAIFKRLRTAGEDGTYLRKAGPFAVTNIRDLTTGFDDNQPDHKAILPTSSSSQMITYTFENGVVCTLRTSGTEPKIKYYSEICRDGSATDARKELDTTVDAIIHAFLEPEKNGLIPPAE
eukprot:TRINITY_DN29266_c0_g1_i1.p1 TRINITY_DN29266_c0_g1~~TRINITY_DN29266_c0_g1_i1.p1  ORF type:complete len:602 (-),score=142.18 TRINITY_DN29266_c0_g1_i1:44-1753(-)